MKTTTKSVIISLIVVLALALITALSVTVAYLTSKRDVVGYLNFASGISIDYKNIKASASAGSPGNLLYFNDENSDGIIAEGELKNLDLSNIMPGDTIKIANPKLTPKEDTASFALRAKLVVTDMSNSDNPVVLVKPSEILAGIESLFSTANLEFAEGWEFNESDNFHYLTTAGEGAILDRLAEIKYNSEAESQQVISLFKGDVSNSDLITFTVVDDGPIEHLPTSTLKIELFIQAIQYSSLSVWNA